MITKSFLNLIFFFCFQRGLRILCRELHLSVREKFPKSEYSVVGGLIFLRFICPAIISPESYGIIPSMNKKD